LIYLFQLILLVDILRLFNTVWPFFPSSLYQNFITAKLVTAFVILIIATIVILYGYINSEIVKVVELTFDIHKRYEEK